MSKRPCVQWGPNSFVKHYLADGNFILDTLELWNKVQLVPMSDSFEARMKIRSSFVLIFGGEENESVLSVARLSLLFRLYTQAGCGDTEYAFLRYM